MSIQTSTSSKTRLSTNQTSDIERHFKNFLEEKLVGQADAKLVALRTFKAYMNPLRDPNRPIFSMFLIGPSRTGKTYLAELLAEFFHGSPEAMTKIQGGQYQERHQIQNLIGAPHGYIGYSDGSNAKKDDSGRDNSAKLAQANLDHLRNGSKANVDIILVDEFEKAHPVLAQLLLNALDKGVIDLNNNTQTNVRNTIFIFTSNLGMDEVERQSTHIGFTATKSTVTKSDVASVVAKSMKLSFAPEFRNRIDAVVVYEPMTAELMLNVVGKEINIINKRILERNPRRIFTVGATQAAKQHLLNEALRGDGNLANLKRVIQTQVLEVLGSFVNAGNVQAGDRIEIDFDTVASELVFDKVSGAMLIGGNTSESASSLPVKPGTSLVPVLSDTKSGSNIVPFPTVGVVIGSIGINGFIMQMGELTFLERAFDLKHRASFMQNLLAEYVISFESEASVDDLANQWLPVVRDLKDIMDVEILSSTTTYTKPFKTEVTIKAIPSQIRLLEVRFPGIKITSKEDPTLDE